MGIKDDAPMVDMAAMRAYRLSRLQGEAQARDCAALLLLDPINIRYATGIKAGQIFATALSEPLRRGAGRWPGHGARLGDRQECLAARKPSAGPCRCRQSLTWRPGLGGMTGSRRGPGMPRRRCESGSARGESPWTSAIPTPSMPSGRRGSKSSPANPWSSAPLRSSARRRSPACCMRSPWPMPQWPACAGSSRPE